MNLKIKHFRVIQRNSRLDSKENLFWLSLYFLSTCQKTCQFLPANLPKSAFYRLPLPALFLAIILRLFTIPAHHIFQDRRCPDTHPFFCLNLKDRPSAEMMGCYAQDDFRNILCPSRNYRVCNRRVPCNFPCAQNRM